MKELFELFTYKREDKYLIRREPFVSQGKFYPYSYDCPVCNGTGIEKYGKVDVVGTTISEYTLFKIKECFFRGDVINLFKLSQKLQEPIYLVSEGGVENGNIFEVGVFSVIVMPRMVDEFDLGAKIIILI